MIDKMAQKISMAELKAIIHLFVIPFALIVLSKNLLVSFIWITFMLILYTLTSKKNTENAIVFLEMFKITIKFACVVLFLLIFILITK